ncbi:Response regulator [Candidatus Terasakiella magnetica]|nr:Response regulator [Candidatus Terasakiella magnetica]
MTETRDDSLASPWIDLLIVEDNPADARLIELMLAEAGGFRCRKAATLAAAVAAIAESAPDAVLLDLSLPDGCGMATIERIRAAGPQLPIVICTGLNDESMGLAALQHGCQDYLVKGQGDGHQIRHTILYAIERKGMEEERRLNADRFKRVLLQTVRSLSLTLEMRDPYTTGHQRRVAQLAAAIGRRMGLEEGRLEGLHTGGLVHDIGKINVPAEFLSRPGKLSAEIHMVIRMHPQMGWEIMHDIEFPWPVATMILQHHERLDGSGYPHGLKGDEIILEARILAVADVLEAISSHRPYRPALGLETALAELRQHSGTRYDPQVVVACIAVIEEYGPAILEDDIPVHQMPGLNS